MRKTLISIFAHATLAAGVCAQNALLGGVVFYAFPRLCPGTSELACWRLLAILFSVTSPWFVLQILGWIKGKAPMGSVNRSM